MHLTKEFYEEYAKRHRMLWRWVSDNPERKKRSHPDWEVVQSLPHFCFACGVKNMQNNSFSHSSSICRSHCPIIEFRCGTNNCVEGSYDTCSYTKYDHHFYQYEQCKEDKKLSLAKKHLKEVSKAAYLVAELPWFEYNYYILISGCLVYDSDIEMAKQHRVVEFKY